MTSSFVNSLGSAVKAWFREYYTSGPVGRLVFDVSVYSSFGSKGLPIYRLSKLALALTDIGVKDLLSQDR